MWFHNSIIRYSNNTYFVSGNNNNFFVTYISPYYRTSFYTRYLFGYLRPGKYRAVEIQFSAISIFSERASYDNCDKN